MAVYPALLSYYRYHRPCQYLLVSVSIYISTVRSDPHHCQSLPFLFLSASCSGCVGENFLLTFTIHLGRFSKSMECASVRLRASACPSRAFVLACVCTCVYDCACISTCDSNHDWPTDRRILNEDLTQNSVFFSGKWERRRGSKEERRVYALDQFLLFEAFIGKLVG